ncbi:MAG: type II toxin-antitoxin system VapC family toxin [Actinobacteria bacterium]|nr:type II toxin-antitoxin system VapC family toxin [Actinomycetota bacterium]
MAAYVLDASVLAALQLREPATEAIAAALARIEGSDLHAPDFALLEVANVMWKRVRMGDLAAEEAMAAMEDVPVESLRLHRTDELVPQALALALAHGFTAYDAIYVALATRVGGTVVTNDGGMRQRGIEAGLPVVAARELA